MIQDGLAGLVGGALILGAGGAANGLDGGVAEGGRIPAATAADEGGGKTPALPAAGDLLLSRLLFRGMLMLT